MTKYNFNKKLNMIINSKDKYVQVIQEYLQEFVNRYASSELAGNYTPYVDLLNKISVRDSLQIKKYMVSHGIEFTVDTAGKKKFKFTKCTLAGCWDTFEKVKKAPKPYVFLTSLKSFINKAKKQNVDSKTIEQLITIYQDLGGEL